MRKILNKLLVLIGVALFSVAVTILTACVWDPSSYYYDSENLRAPVTAIELITYDNPNQKSFDSWIPDHSDDLQPINMSAIQVTETLDPSKINGFMLDLSKEQIMYKYYAFDSPKGTGIRIKYSDGYFDIISCNDNSFSDYIGTFTPSGEVDNFIGCFASYSSFENLLQKYFGS